MIAFPAGARVWIAGGVTDMRCGMNSLALKIQQGPTFPAVVERLGRAVFRRRVAPAQAIAIDEYYATQNMY